MTETTPQTLAALQLGPWPGGVRYDLPTEDVAAHEVSDMQNVRIGTGGQLETRPGTASYGSAAAIAGAPTGTMVAQFNATATTSFVAEVFGAAIYKNVAGTRTAITAALTVTAGDDYTWEWADCNGKIAAVNGQDTDGWVWTGTGNATLLDDDARFTKGRHIAWFDNRLWIGNVNGATYQLWYSDTADIATWGATSYFNFGGVITGLVPAYNALIVHTTDGIYTLSPTGNATTPYHPDHRTEQAGIDGRSCISLPDDSQLMLTREGVYVWTGGGELEKVSYALDGRYWDGLNADRLFKAFAVRVPKRGCVWFFLPYGATQTEMNSVMIYNYERRTEINGRNVGTWYGPYNGWERNAAALINDQPHAVDFDGYLWDHDADEYSDGGAAITQFAETGAPAPYGSHVSVAWAFARHYYNATGDYDLDVTQLGAEIVGVQRLS
jgi:hypothetical protein